MDIVDIVIPPGTPWIICPGVGRNPDKRNKNDTCLVCGSVTPAKVACGVVLATAFWYCENGVGSWYRLRPRFIAEYPLSAVSDNAPGAHIFWPLVGVMSKENAEEQYRRYILSVVGGK